MRHLPVRPAWLCDTCAEPWPCPPARGYMLTAWEPVCRAMTMGAYFFDACADLPDRPAGELHDRFIRWQR